MEQRKDKSICKDGCFRMVGRVAKGCKSAESAKLVQRLGKSHIITII